MRYLSRKKGALIKIIQISCELWIRSKCKSIDEVKFDLEGSAFEILSGKISSAKLIAYNINFNDISIHHINLTSQKLTLSIDIFNKDQKVLFDQHFNIIGNILLKSKGLNKTILSKQWNSIGCQIANQLLGADKLHKVEIINNKLEIQGLDIKTGHVSKNLFEVEAHDRSIRFQDAFKKKKFLLPIDPLINIKNVALSKGEMMIEISAIVKP